MLNLFVCHGCKSIFMYELAIYIIVAMYWFLINAAIGTFHELAFHDYILPVYKNESLSYIWMVKEEQIMLYLLKS